MFYQQKHIIIEILYARYTGTSVTISASSVLICSGYSLKIKMTLLNMNCVQMWIANPQGFRHISYHFGGWTHLCDFLKCRSGAIVKLSLCDLNDLFLFYLVFCFFESKVWCTFQIHIWNLVWHEFITPQLITLT